jgi:hypothetical protein
VTRIPFSAPVTRIIEARAAGRCEQCGAECPTRADYEIDHIVAEGVRPADDNRDPLTADDGKLLCLKCHRKKTAHDVFAIAKTNRLAKKHRVVGSGRTELARRYGVKQEEPDK